MRGAIPSLSQYAFMAWCSVKAYGPYLYLLPGSNTVIVYTAGGLQALSVIQALLKFRTYIYGRHRTYIPKNPIPFVPISRLTSPSPLGWILQIWTSKSITSPTLIPSNQYPDFYFRRMVTSQLQLNICVFIRLYVGGL